MTRNRLGDETSPYLLQHKDNPVHWRAWGQEALDEAQVTGKPILLSIGYAACHWCHVMAHESFENPSIAALMNELYIPIKVDREERPDIDAIYQHALSLLGQQGGWPLTMFLTPDAQPFWGGTYFPPESRWGRPGFAEVLRGVAQTYRHDGAKINGNVGALARGLARLSQPASAGPVDVALLDQIAERFAGAIDPVQGGLRGAPKFPNCPVLELLWRAYRRSGTQDCRRAVLLTLERISQGGIYDHLGGGYSRYSTDEVWLAPHFEKMLYDNAQLLDLLVWAWQDTGEILFKERIEETIAWLTREMRAEGGGFWAALDADSEHEEGKFYVWSEAEIDRLLGPAAPAFKAAYDVTPGGNWEEKNILNRSSRPERLSESAEQALATSRAILLAARAERIRPERDDKVLADWNGLMIHALARAAVALDQPEWLELALNAWRFILSTMQIDDGRLLHSYRQGRVHPGTLDDHAAMALAGVSLYEATGNDAYLDQARHWMEMLEQHFADAAGGYFFAAADTATLIIRIKAARDSAVPSGNGVALAVLARLYGLTGEEIYLHRAERLIEAFSGELERDYFSLPAYLNGIDFLATLLQIVIVGEREANDTEMLLRAVRGISLPSAVLSVISPGDVLPSGHPAAGRPQLDGRATAYICRGRTCSLPVTSPEELVRQLH